MTASERARELEAVLDEVLEVLEQHRETDCIRCQDKWANPEVIELIAKLKKIKGEEDE